MEELVDTARRALQSGPPLRLVVLFGSSATGRLRADSDIDLAILPRDPALTLRDEMFLAADLAKAFGREIDLVRLDHASPLLRWEVARTGIVVLADQWEWPRFRAAAASEHADIAEAVHRAAKLFRRRIARSNA